MQRAVFHGGGRVSVEHCPTPTPAAGELLLRVHACALCGSDRDAWESGSVVTPGHEIAGEVVAAGSEVSTPIGTRGAVYLVNFCDHCALCMHESRGACLDKHGMIGFNRDGGFAQFVAIPERCLLPIHDRIDLDAAIMLLDVVGTAMHAIKRAAFATPPTSALVMGAGPVGLGCVLALNAVGVELIVAIDVSPFRLELARGLSKNFKSSSMVVAVPGGDTADDMVRSLLPDGPRLVIEASGNPSAQRQALDLLAPGGTMVIVGHSRGVLEIRTSRDLIQYERHILGSEYFDNREIGRNQDLLLSGTLAPVGIITHRLPLEKISEAYRLFWSGETGKVLVYPNGIPRG